jgi:hypothetical protein
VAGPQPLLFESFYAIFKLTKIAFLASLIVVAAAEVGLRYFGLLDFPLYENSQELATFRLPNQQGSYLRKYRWAFNELSMVLRIPSDLSSTKRNILLIGDSIVMGLNSEDQAARLAPS